MGIDLSLDHLGLRNAGERGDLLMALTLIALCDSSNGLYLTGLVLQGAVHNPTVLLAAQPFDFEILLYLPFLAQSLDPVE